MSLSDDEMTALLRVPDADVRAKQGAAITRAARRGVAARDVGDLLLVRAWRALMSLIQPLTKAAGDDAPTDAPVDPSPAASPDNDPEANPNVTSSEKE